MSEELVIVAETDPFEGEILRSYLEAHEIPVFLSRESAGAAYGLGVGLLGKVEIRVRPNDHTAAEKLINTYYRNHDAGEG